MSRSLKTALRRIVRPAAMVAVVGAVSVSLIVSTPSNAQAFDGADLLQKEAPRFVGAVKTLAPAAVVVATSVTPTGWALKAAWSLGMLALNTADIWVPWVAGQFGAATSNASTPAPSGTFDPRVDSTGVTMVNGWTARVAVTINTAGTDNLAYTAYHVSASIQCRSNKDGTGDNYDKKTVSVAQYRLDSATTNTFDFGCQYGYLTGGVFGAVGADPELTAYQQGAGGGPKTVQRVGTYVKPGTNGFDPHGSNVGYQGRSECITADGTTSWISGPTIAGDQGAVKMPSCAAAGKGIGTGRNQVVAFKPDGTQETVWDVPVAPSDPSTPLCTPGTTSSGCTLEVLKDDQPCVVGDPECENWESEQQKDPTRYKCKFGPYTLPLSACNLLERAYRIGGALATEKNTDGDPATQDNTNYAGQPVPQPAPGPVSGTGPGAGPGGTPAPGGSGQVSPTADPKSRNCFPTGYAAFNPVEWVLQPLRCAFEPSQSSQDSVNNIPSRFNSKAPFLWMSGAGAVVAGASSMGSAGCPNWVVTVGTFSKNVVCDSTFTAALVASRPSILGLLILVMFWPLIRSLWYAVIPIIRPTPMA